MRSCGLASTLLLHLGHGRDGSKTRSRVGPVLNASCDLASVLNLPATGSLLEPARCSSLTVPCIVHRTLPSVLRTRLFSGWRGR